MPVQMTSIDKKLSAAYIVPTLRWTNDGLHRSSAVVSGFCDLIIILFRSDHSTANRKLYAISVSVRKSRCIVEEKRLLLVF